MTGLRHFIHDRRHFAAALVVLALLMRLLLPTGFMPEVSAGKLTIALCTGHGPAVIDIALPTGGHGHDKQGQPAKPDMPCPFSSASGHGLAGANPILLAIAIAFAMLLCLRPATIVPVSTQPRLRPPLRGPPLTV